MEERVKNALDHQDIEYIKTILIEIKDEVKKTNGRVTRLELWKARSVGVVVGVSAVCAAVFTVVKFFLGL